MLVVDSRPAEPEVDAAQAPYPFGWTAALPLTRRSTEIKMRLFGVSTVWEPPSGRGTSGEGQRGQGQFRLDP